MGAFRSQAIVVDNPAMLLLWLLTAWACTVTNPEYEDLCRGDAACDKECARFDYCEDADVPPDSAPDADGDDADVDRNGAADGDDADRDGDVDQIDAQASGDAG